MKVKELRATLKSIEHVLGGYNSALSCMEAEDVLPKEHVHTLRKYIERELNRLEAGLPPVVEENHVRTRKI